MINYQIPEAMQQLRRDAHVQFLTIVMVKEETHSGTSGLIRIARFMGRKAVRSPMVDFKALMNKPPMTDAEHDQLWKDWYNGLPESEKKVVDKLRARGAP